MSTTKTTCTFLVHLLNFSLTSHFAKTTTTKTENTFTTTTNTTIEYDKDKKMRAAPNKSDAFAVFLHKDSDVAKHILSFLDTHTDEFRQIAARLKILLEEESDSDSAGDY